jgi:transcriptional regulator with XRE-family HTH domain
MKGGSLAAHSLKISVWHGRCTSKIDRRVGARMGWKSHQDGECFMSENRNSKGPSPQGDSELGRRLSSMRLRAGMTQTDIAGKAAVSRQHISNIEIGITSPTVRVLQDYLQACCTDLAEFFYGPLPVNQTARQREYHRKLQALLENDTMSPVITKTLDSFTTSMQSSLTALVQPIRVQARRARAQHHKKGRAPSSRAASAAL